MAKIDIELNVEKAQETLDKFVGQTGKQISESLGAVDFQSLQNEIEKTILGIHGMESSFMGTSDGALKTMTDNMSSFSEIISDIGFGQLSATSESAKEAIVRLNTLLNETYGITQGIAIPQTLGTSLSEAETLLDRLTESSHFLAETMKGVDLSANLQAQLEAADTRLIDMDSNARAVKGSLGQVGDEGEKAGDKIKRGFSTKTLRRFAFGLLGFQSIFSLMSRATRDYMESNDAMKSSMLGITSALGQMLAPMLGFMIGLFQKLVRWTMIAIAYFTTFINVIFGTNIAIKTTLDATGKAAKGMDKLGNSTKKNANKMKKAFKGMLAPFDELNVISEDTSDNMDDLGASEMGGIGGAMPVMPDMSAFDISEHIAPLKVFAEWLDKNRELVKEILIVLGAMAIAWLVITAITTTWGGLMALIASPWIIGIALIMAAAALLWYRWDDIVIWFKGAWDATAKFFVGIWDWAVKLVSGIFSAIGTFFGNILTHMKETVSRNVESIKNFFSVMGEFIGKVWDVIKNYVAEKWNNITTNISNGIQAIKDWFTSMGEFIAQRWENLKNNIAAIWDIIKAFIRYGIDSIKVWFIEMYLKFQEAWQSMKDFFSGVWEWIKNAIRLGVDMVVEFFNRMGRGFGVMWEGAKTVFKNVWDWITNGISSGVENIKGKFNAIGTVFKNVFENIKSVFSRIWDFIVGSFSKGGSIFAGFTDGVAGVFKTIVNTMIRGINTVLGAPFKALNGLLNGFRDIKVLGMRPFGFIPHNVVPVPKIPQFKKGYVGTSAQMGQFGEYPGAKFNPEIVTPNDLMAETVENAMAKFGGNNDSGDLHITIKTPDGNIERTIKEYKKYKRHGGKLELV